MKKASPVPPPSSAINLSLSGAKTSAPTVAVKKAAPVRVPSATGSKPAATGLPKKK